MKQITISKIKQKLNRAIKLSYNAFLKYREFRNDKNYNIRAVDKGFKDRRILGCYDTKILTRIIKAYNLAKEAQNNAGPSFRPSNEWLPIYEAHLGEIISILKDRNINKLREKYINFFRESCSAGLHGLPIDMNKYYFGGRINKFSRLLILNDTIHRYRLWKKMLGNEFDVRQLAAPLIGNPYGIYIDGTLINCGFYQHYYAVQIARLCKEMKNAKILELGGGYGGMAYFLIRDNENIRYLDFDLPENAALTAYYLLTAFPEKKVLLFGEDELSIDAIENNSIIIMPSFECTKLPDRSIDLAFNSYSLAEMSPETVETFIFEFMRIVRNYILHVNHNSNSVVVADEFGIDPSKYDLLHKKKALWNLGINPNMDEYEYLYQRIER